VTWPPRCDRDLRFFGFEHMHALREGLPGGWALIPPWQLCSRADRTWQIRCRQALFGLVAGDAHRGASLHRVGRFARGRSAAQLVDGVPWDWGEYGESASSGWGRRGGPSRWP